MAFNPLDLLNGISKKESDNYRGLDEIKLSREEIIITKHNKYSMDDLQEMATGIELAGEIQEPLILGKIDGKFCLASGHRRIGGIDILLEEGKEQFRIIPCRYKDMTELEFRMHLLIGNKYNRKMTDYDLMMETEEWKAVLTECIDQEKKRAEEEGEEKPKSGRVREYIRQITGMSDGKIGTLDAINNNATEEIKEQFQKGNVGITGAHAASRLPEEKQKEVAEKLEKGDIKSEQIQQIVKERKETEKREQESEEEKGKMQQPEPEEEDKTVAEQRKENVSDLDTTDQEKENAKRLHALKMLEKYYTFLNDEEVRILGAMLEDCKRRKREYSFD